MVENRSVPSFSGRPRESAINDEHVEIRTLMSRAMSTGDPRELLPLLETLHNALERHFEREEGEQGLYAIVVDAAPRLVPRVHELVAEHQEFMDTLSGMIQQTRSVLEGPMAEIRNTLDEFNGKMSLHDAAESEILTDSLMRDIGSGD